MNETAQADDGIPLLTDVVLPAQSAPLQAVSAASIPVPAPANLQNTNQLYQLVQPAWPDGSATSLDAAAANPSGGAQSINLEAEEAWREELTQRVQSRVLAGLTARIDPLVEQRLRESLTDLLEQVLAGMTAELKVTARNIVRDAVAQAVAAELAQLHSAKPG